MNGLDETNDSPRKERASRGPWDRATRSLRRIVGAIAVAAVSATGGILWDDNKEQEKDIARIEQVLQDQRVFPIYSATEVDHKSPHLEDLPAKPCICQRPDFPEGKGPIEICSISTECTENVMRICSQLFSPMKCRPMSN